jgi:hypothetical protein
LTLDLWLDIIMFFFSIRGNMNSSSSFPMTPDLSRPLFSD